MSVSGTRIFGMMALLQDRAVSQGLDSIHEAGAGVRSIFHWNWCLTARGFSPCLYTESFV